MQRSSRTLAFAVVIMAPLVSIIVAPSTAQAGNSYVDLQPTLISYDPAALAAGERTIHFESGVENDGSSESGVFNVKWRVDGREVGAYGSHASVGGNSMVLDGNSQFDWTFDEPGTYKVEFVVDVDDQVAESDESDNAGTATVFIRSTTNSDQPNLSELERFNQWLNDCVSGRLDEIDPLCKEQSRDVAGVSIDPASIATCLIEGGRGRSELIACFGPKIFGLWEHWSSSS